MSSSILARRIVRQLTEPAFDAVTMAESKRLAQSSTGLLCCLVAVCSYTVGNLCQRSVADVCDPLWVTWMRAAVPAVALAFWFALQCCRTRPVCLPRRLLLALLAASLLAQWGGNLMFQVALAQVGVSVTVPLTFGLMLFASAVLGRIFLREQVSTSTTCALTLVLTSLICLGAGVASGPAPGSTAGTFGMTGLAGIGAALLAGGSFAISTLIMRRVMALGVSSSTVVFIVTFTGMVTLGLCAVWRVGAQDLVHATPRTHALLIMVGTCNLIGFLGFTTGLRLSNLVSANTVNAFQVVATAVLGAWLFAEPFSTLMIVGAMLNMIAQFWIGLQR